MLTRGHAAEETIEAAARARSLAEKTGNLAALAQQLFSIWAVHIVASDNLGASALGEQLLDLARQEGSPASFAFAHHALVLARFNRGLLVDVEKHYTSWNTFREAPAYVQLRAVAISRGYAVLNAWMMGSVDSARKRAAEMVTLAQAGNDPYEIAFAQLFKSCLHYVLREPSLATAAAGQALSLSEQHEFSFVTAFSQGILGWARAQLGSPDEGILLIRQNLSGYAETGSRIFITDVLTRLAEAQVLDGAIDEALGTIEDALQANPEELVYQPNILTRRGDLRLKQGQVESAEADFRAAIVLAQKMSAKAWELRATTSLARLLRDTDRREEARAMLAEIYGWFTEGFDTAALVDAKALLDELTA